ncbi:MAG: hypothetical protein R3324_02810 [Halobacteriales archaeon]|nr:hypothetical protein [Halobacteriales archaeon]
MAADPSPRVHDVDAVLERLPSRPLAGSEAIRLDTVGGFELAHPFVKLVNGGRECIIVVYVRTGTFGDYIGYNPVVDAWEHVGVADVSDERVVHIRSMAQLFSWIDVYHPDANVDFIEL